MTLPLTMDIPSRNADIHARWTSPTGYLDPLEDDRTDDPIVITTKRGICRVALVATEVGDRFRRDGVDCDAMTWMLSPRRLFEGANAIDACLERDACLRGVIVHALSLGMDADPAFVDALADDDPEDEVTGGIAEIDSARSDRDPALSLAHDGSPGAIGRDAHANAEGLAGLRLFTATIVSTDGFETVQAFHASLAHDPEEIAGRLFMRIGPASADAVIVPGFDPTEPLIEALVAPAMCHTLEQIDADPASPLAAGLDLNIEQRFYT